MGPGAFRRFSQVSPSRQYINGQQLTRVISLAEVVLGTSWWHSCIPVTHASRSNSSKLIASPAGLGQSPFFDLVGAPVGKCSLFPASSSTSTIFYSFNSCQHTVCMGIL